MSPNPCYFEKKMHSPLFCWSTNALLVLIILLNAELGGLVGIQNQILPISVVWPATGFALAALLLFGYKVWPAIFLGNFLYNFYHIGEPSLTSFLAATIISSGSLLQALLGCYIMRRYASLGYFNSVRDVLIFLIPVGLIANLIASTLGVITFYLLGGSNLFMTFLTFWIGDSMGVYVLTPLLVVWLTSTPMVRLHQHAQEAFWMAFAFMLLSFFTLILNYPAAQLFIPLSIWVSYRFHMHGAALVIFLIALVTLTSTAFGFGSFIFALRVNPLALLVTFLEIIVFTCLVIAGIVQERTRAWLLLQNHNIDLQEEVKDYQNELKELQYERSFQEKRSSLVELLLAMHTHMQHSILKIGQLTKTLQEQPQKIESSLQQLVKAEQESYKTAKLLEAQTKATFEKKIQIQLVNLHTLLNISLDKVAKEKSVLYPEFTYTLTKNYDKGIELIPAFADDLAYAFEHFFNNAFTCMIEKKILLKGHYTPTLDLQTINHHSNIEIVIKNNGQSFSKEELEHIFRSLLSEEPITEAEKLALALAHDNIVHMHKGKIKINAKEGEFAELILTLPK